MTVRAFDPFAGAERWTWPTAVGVVLLPVAVAVLLSWALGAPARDLARVTAAVVNADQPVQVDGQTVPLGREFAGALVGGDAGEGAPGDPGPDASASPAPSGPSFTWVLTNGDDAVEGLDAGRYAAIVRIPPSFSADATSLSGPAKDAVTATVHVTTTPATAFLDPALTDVVVQAAVASLDAQLTARYLAQLYEGFTTIHDSVAQAADGAAQLASGTDTLASGADDLATGATQLSRGLDSLDAGAADLAAGMGTLAGSVGGLPTETTQLATGAAEVAGALDGEAAILAASAATVAALAADLCDRPRQPGCTRATALAERTSAAADAVATLARGADAVAVGNTELAAGMPALVAGVDGADAGADEVAAGAEDAATGGADVAAGADRLASGAASADEGARQLSDGLEEAVTQIPSYGSRGIATLSTVAARPVLTDVSAAPDGIVSVPLFAAVGLWIGGIAIALGRRAVPRRWLTTAVATPTVAARAAGPTVALGAIQGLLVGAAVAGFVDVAAGQRAWFVAAATLAGAVLALANQALAAAFGGVGRWVAVAIATVALAAGTSSTVPAVVHGIDGVLPVHMARRVMGAALGVGDAPGPLVALGVVTATSALLVLGGIARRRAPDVSRA
ncbi:hypothetical protein [Demequina phytophila]|uniref:hypothetical protein n=1 Tax=Demequina phytophila TaxID=1638981 RepID=UPI000B0A04C4|nr:hypothetical protein [Demequina phytophila]